MSLEIILVLIIIGVALVLFVSDVVPVDLTAILVMTSLMLTGILTPEEAVSGFSNTATITILGLLIISEGLKNTGAVERLGDQVAQLAGRREWSALFVLMGIAGMTSAFINTTAVVAVFIPVVFQISRRSRIHPAILLIPLSFAAMVGGSSTMIGTSTNLLIGALAESYGLESFNIFKPTLFGALLLIAIMLYMATIGRVMLRPAGEVVEVLDQVVDAKQYLTEITIPGGSRYIGESLEESGLADHRGFHIVGLDGDGKSKGKINPKWVLREGDTLIIKTDVSEIVRLNSDPDLRISTALQSGERLTVEENEEPELFEVLVAANSNLLDQRIKDVDFTSYYDARPLAVKKIRIQPPERLMNHKISYGDILLMRGKSHPEHEGSRNEWIKLQAYSPEVIRAQHRRQDRLWTSIGVIIGVILLAVLGILPILVSAWVGVCVMFFTGCLTLKRAYDNVEWKVIFLLAGVIPLGAALAETGADLIFVDALIEVVGQGSLRFVVSVFFLVTVLLTGIISNQATAVLLFPIAIHLAETLQIPAEPLVMTILFGASSSFLTPVGYQTNAMVYGPGNYKFVDFIKVGGPLCLLLWVLVTIFVPMIYG